MFPAPLARARTDKAFLVTQIRRGSSLQTFSVIWPR